MMTRRLDCEERLGNARRNSSSLAFRCCRRCDVGLAGPTRDVRSAGGMGRFKAGREATGPDLVKSLINCDNGIVLDHSFSF